MGRKEAGKAVKTKMGQVPGMGCGYLRLRRFDRGLSCHGNSCGGLIVNLSQALDLEALGYLEEGGEVLLIHRHLAPVHELEESFHFVIPNVAKKDDGMSVGGVVKEGLKIGRTG